MTMPPPGGCGPAGRAQRWRALSRSALLGCAIAELPALLHGAAMFWLWGALAALLGMAFAGAGADQLRATGTPLWWPCALAGGVGVTIDFHALPPHIMLSMCRAGSGLDFGMAIVAAHVRELPAMTLAMLLAITITQVRARLHARPQRVGPACLRALPGIAFEFATMLMAMSLSVQAFAWLAGRAHLPWTADGMCMAMLAGMLAIGRVKLSRTVPRYMYQ